MKKILLLLVSGLLIACMAGSAMAIGLTVDLPINPTTKLPYMTINPNGGGATANAIFTVDNDLGGNYIFQVTTDSDDLKAKIIDLNSQSTLLGWLSQPAVQTITGLSGGTANPCKLYVEGGTGGIVTIFAEGPEGAARTQKVEVSVQTQIPEYPVAIAVASVIGLLFIFGRKKEGL